VWQRLLKHALRPSYRGGQSLPFLHVARVFAESAAGLNEAPFNRGAFDASAVFNLSSIKFAAPPHLLRLR
jgi:hypothetical protein